MIGFWLCATKFSSFPELFVGLFPDISNQTAHRIKSFIMGLVRYGWLLARCNWILPPFPGLWMVEQYQLISRQTGNRIGFTLNGCVHYGTSQPIWLILGHASTRLPFPSVLLSEQYPHIFRQTAHGILCKFCVCIYCGTSQVWLTFADSPLSSWFSWILICRAFSANVWAKHAGDWPDNVWVHFLWTPHWPGRINFWYHIEAETKWPPFSRRHFQMHFLEWKCMNFD